ncbi:hypothetical protein [Serpentinimonas barnesii]|uniref:hypothetical protein n=1 Tax=Serpentinimonas barnesii TaxID=1458427 RepID=UPI0005EFD6AA|nr:hypothetical protein [Serpentinimonas barnesii]
MLPPPAGPTASDSIHQAPIAQRIAWLHDLAQRHGEAFRGPETWLERQRYRAQHPSAIAALMCMDGRVNLALATQLPAGIITPFRNLGGMFNLGWPYLSQLLIDYVNTQTQSGRRVLLLITYHWSRGERKRGCAGFRYRRDDSLAHAWAIHAQVSELFGPAHQSVFPLVCGFETDEEALLLHGPGGETLDLAAFSETPPPSFGTGAGAGTGTEPDALALEAQLVRTLPGLPRPVRADLLPLLLGNLAHIAAVRAQPARELVIEHREWVICLGRGFDFLHTPNLALMIGPYSPDLAQPIRTAASIIHSNMHAKRIPADGFLLLTSMPYENQGVERAGAALRARFLAHFATQVITEAHPDLAPLMHRRCAVLDWPARRLELLPD